jgi:hypothetical protein
MNSSPYKLTDTKMILPQAPLQALPARLSIREKIQYSLLGLALVGGATFLAGRTIRKARARSEQNKTLADGSAATSAKRIKMAFDNDGWWGTDKDALRLAIREISSKSEFRKVMKSYQKLYNSNLLGDMQSELKSTEYSEMLSIVSVKPETDQQGVIPITPHQVAAWAKRLKAAFDIYYGPFPGTDEPAIRAVFIELPTQSIFRQLYGGDLITELRSELESWEYAPMMQIILSKPKI